MSKTRKVDTSKYKWLEKDKKVWVENSVTSLQDEMFTQCIAKEINEAKHLITVETTQGKIMDVDIQRCLKCTYGPSDVSDMVDLEQLNEPELLWNIKRRYFNDLIFTLCGPTLLIINPYTTIEKLFTDEILYEHQSLVFSQALQYKSQAPHIYGLAGFCLWQLFDNNRNQSIVISGESGAGKTENTKYCLKFLASLGKNLKEIALRKTSSSAEAQILLKRMHTNTSKLNGIEDKILGCNQILEAFGNAKTIRNDNSSRFGKLIILLYGATKVDIRSAFITNYLLEKSRIVAISKNQRNYHVFYYFCKGCSQEQRKKYKLTLPIDKYYFLNQSDEYQAGNIKDEIMFEKLKAEFRLYLTQQEVSCVLSIVSTVLQLGNIQFSIRQNEKKEEFIVIKGEEFLKNAAELININPEELSRALQFRKRTFKEGSTQSPFRLDEALALRDSFAKNLYQKLFHFLVYKLNQKIQIEKVDLEDLQNRSSRKSVGILDIFGFEILTNNSLEQFFINFANEKLQQLYVSYIFKEQQNEFNRQGLEKFSYQFDFADNKPIIEMIQHYPQGIMHLINQASELNKQDSSLPQTVIKKHGKNMYVVIPKFKNENFLINHSCSPVEYSSKGFVAKNKDQFPAQMADLVNKIQNEIMKSIVTFDADKNKAKQGGTGKKFLATKFLKQINDLVEELYSSDCHFVRCIKPNEKKKPKLLHSGQVLQSLRNLGVLDSIKIRKLGYVYRRPFKQFCKKFYELQAYNYNFNQIIDDKTEEELKEMVNKIVMKYSPKELKLNYILIGHNKILINQSSINNFELQAKQRRRLRIQVANRFKIAFKKHVFRQQVSNFLFSVSILKQHMISFKRQVSNELRLKKISKIQKSIKQYLTKVRFKKIEAIANDKVILIIRWWRMVVNRKKFLKAKKKAVKIQAHVRKYLTALKTYRQRLIKIEIKNIFNKAWAQIQNNNATLIQKVVRGHQIRIKYKEQIQQIQIAKQEAMLKMTVTSIQKWWRYRLFKKNMSKYILAAQKIQATFKSHILKKIYKDVQKSIKVIQRIVKKHIGKKFLIGKVWKVRNQALKQLEIERYKELYELGLFVKPTKTSLKYSLNSVTTKIQVAAPIDLQNYFLDKQMLLPVVSSISSFYIHHQDKNDFQACILDIDLMSPLSSTYEDRWGSFYKTIIEAMKQRMEYPIKIEVADNFTCVITQKGRVYQFGQVFATGDKQYNVIDKGTPFKMVCNQYQGYMLTTERQLYTWGDNDSDQLMKGYSSAPNPFEENTYLPMERIDTFEVKGKNKYLTSFGRVYEYYTPANQPENHQLFKLTRQVNFFSKVNINEIVASFNFVHFITTSGQLYSKGSNSSGQLGLGHRLAVQQPQQNKFLRDSKQIVDTISVGYKHTVCKTRLGYVYAWGDNNFRQVCEQAVTFCSEPQKIQPQKATKAYSAVAGFRCSAVLLQNSKIYSWGTNSSLNKSGFQRLEYEKMYQLNSNSNSSLIPLKLCSTWSHNMSIIYINALNQHKCKKTISKQNIIKTIKNVCKEWTFDKIFPPYSEMAENNLNLTDLKKYKFKSSELRSSLHEEAIKNPFKQIDMLIHSKGQTGEISSLNMTAKQKLEEMLKILIDKKPDEEWTEEQRTLFSYLQNPRIQKLIKNL